MTAEQLLVPRIQCISPFPGMKREGFELDLIFEPDEETRLYPKKFPANFRKLEWWEYRKDTDLPAFIRCIKTPDHHILPGDVLLILEWFAGGCGKTADKQIAVLNTNCFVPANQMEYYFGEDGVDDLLEDAARIIVQNQSGSTSLIQRRLKLGYNRAGKLMDQLLKAGIVEDISTKDISTKSREVKFKTELELDQHLQSLGFDIKNGK